MIIGGFSLNAQNLKLEWPVICDPNITKYTLYYTTNVAPNPNTNIVSEFIDDCGIFHSKKTNVYFASYINAKSINVIGTNTCTISNLLIGPKYYFTITYSTLNFESDKSAELSYTFTNKAPAKIQNLIILKYNK